MEMKPAFAAATAGRRPDELDKMAKTMLALLEAVSPVRGLRPAL